MRPAKKIAALGGGFALTMGVALLGLLRLGHVLHRAKSSGEGRIERSAEDGSKRVKLNPGGLYYFEGENSLRLTAEIASDRRGAYYIVYVLTPPAWVREMPDWYRYRRDEVLVDIKRLTSDRRIEWVEEDLRSAG